MSGRTLQDTGQRTFLKHFGQVSFFQLLNSASTFLVNIVIARMLGVQAFGDFFFFISASVVATILFDFGLTRTLIRYSAFHQARGEVSTKLQYYAAVLKLKTGLGLATLLLAGVLSMLFARGLIGLLAMGLLTGFLVSYCQYLSAVAQTENNYKAYNLVLSFSLVRLLVVGGLFMLGIKSAWVLYSVFILSPVVAALWPAFRLGQELIQAQPVLEKDFYSTLVRFGKWMIVLSLLETLYQRLDVVMVRAMTSSEIAGHYSGALAFFGVVYLLPAYIAVLIYPRLVEALGKKDTKAFAQHYRLATDLVALISIPLALGLWAIAPEAVQLILGPEFAAAEPVFKYLAVYALLWACQINSGAVLFAKDQPQRVVGIVACALVVNAGLNWLLIPLLGIIGAGMAVCGAMAVSLVLYWGVIKREFNLLPHAGHLGVYLVAGILMAVAVRAVAPGGWVMLTLKVMLGAGVYAGSLLLAQRLLPTGVLPQDLLPGKWRAAKAAHGE